MVAILCLLQAESVHSSPKKKEYYVKKCLSIWAQTYSKENSVILRQQLWSLTLIWTTTATLLLSPKEKFILENIYFGEIQTIKNRVSAAQIENRLCFSRMQDSINSYKQIFWAICTCIPSVWPFVTEIETSTILF